MRCDTCGMPSAGCDAIKEQLRDGVRSKVLTGWYHHAPYRGESWVVLPAGGASAKFSHEGVTEYAGMLQAALG